MKALGRLLKRFRWAWRLCALVVLERRLRSRFYFCQMMPFYDHPQDSEIAYWRLARAYNRARLAWGPILRPARRLYRLEPAGRRLMLQQRIATRKKRWGGFAAIPGL